MEIPKSLQEEIQSVQNKLKNAIQNHQVYVGKLNDDPNNQVLLGQLHDIQEHIISLSKCQKQVVQRLRKEVKIYEAANSNGTKVSIASLLGLNNNNNITNNNETKTSDSKQIVYEKNLNGLSRRSSKDDYEDGIQNLDLPSPVDDCQNDCAKVRPRLGETDSNDEDVVEIAVADNSVIKRNRNEICEIQLYDQLDFLGCLGLITSDKHTELQNKRAERKRRSTANPQFVYSNWEIPTKRKRHSYLQSNGTAPQTRQTTARLNGPSPPPHKITGIKPLPPPPRAPIKSFIPTQKSTTRPNILRNNTESKLFTGKIKSENGLTQGQTGLSSKSVQSVGSKAVHIPGLPSSLTIERIESDCAAVCINCRNPGSLAVCEICAANFHISCHVVTPAPPKTCPKCLTRIRVQDSSNVLAVDCKEEDEIATTSNTSGFVGETGENSEVDKTARRFYKGDAAEEQRPVSTIGINQLPSSTFLIPIAPNSVPSSSTSSTSFSTICVSQSEGIVTTSASINGESKLSSTPYSSILLNQLSQSTSIQPESKVSYTYQLPVSGIQQEKSQSYLILKKISDSSAIAGRSRPLSSSTVAGNQTEKRNSSSLFDYQQSSSAGYNDHDQSEIKSIPAAQVNDYSQPTGKQFTRKFMHNGKGFNGAEDTTPKPILGQSESTTKVFNGDKRLRKLHSKLSISQLRPSRQSNTFIPLHSIIDDAESLNQFDISKHSENSGKIGQFLPGITSGKGKSKTNLLHSLFPSNNEPHPFPGRVINPQDPGTDQIESEFGRHSSKDRESKHDTIDGTGPRLQSNSSTNVSEHVKLEEAHLPAPLRPNLVRKSVDKVDAIVNKIENSDSYSREGKSDEEFIDVVKSKIGKDDINSDFTSFEDYHNENLKATLNFIAVERNHSNTYIKFHDFKECGDLGDRQKSNKICGTDEKVSISCGMSELFHKSLPALRNKQLLPHEIKAEFERQDLPINESKLTEYEEATMQDKNTNLSEEGKAKLGINAVSTENMQVLEQFESAMLEVDEDETANC